MLCHEQGNSHEWRIQFSEPKTLTGSIFEWQNPAHPDILSVVIMLEGSIMIRTEIIKEDQSNHLCVEFHGGLPLTNKWPRTKNVQQSVIKCFLSICHQFCTQFSYVLSYNFPLLEVEKRKREVRTNIEIIIVINANTPVMNWQPVQGYPTTCWMTAPPWPWTGWRGFRKWIDGKIP